MLQVHLFSNAHKDHMWRRARDSHDSARAPPASRKRAARTPRACPAWLMQPGVLFPSWTCSSRACPRPRSLMAMGTKTRIPRKCARRTSRRTLHFRWPLWRMRPRCNRHSHLSPADAAVARRLRSRSHHRHLLDRDCPGYNFCEDRRTPPLFLCRWRQANSLKGMEMAEVRNRGRRSRD